MAKELMSDGSIVEVTPGNWNDLAYQERQLQEAHIGRKLTPAESISIIENYRAKGMNSAPIDDAARIAQVAGSVTYENEARKLYGDELVDVGVGVVHAAKAAGNVAAQAAGITAVAGLAIGALLLWKFLSK
jgi:hypothetical protein